MAKKIETRNVAQWSNVGEWHIGPAAPNGCVAGRRERYVHEVCVYAADFYGNGEKLYVDVRTYLQSGANFVCTNSSSDGCPERIAKMCADSGVVL